MRALFMATVDSDLAINRMVYESQLDFIPQMGMPMMFGTRSAPEDQRNLQVQYSAWDVELGMLVVHIEPPCVDSMETLCRLGFRPETTWLAPTPAKHLALVCH